MAHRPLAVFTPDHPRVLQATFIRRHAEMLLPGRTVVMAPVPDGCPDLPDLPTLDLRQIVGGRLRWQAAHGVCRQLGWKLDHWMIQRFLRRHRVEVVLAEYLDFAVQWLDLARRLGLRFFAHAHGDDVILRLREPEWREAYLQYQRADGVITMSRFARDELIALGLDPARVHAVPCCVDVPPEPLSRQPGAEIVCVASGRVVTQKAPILLLDAFRRAAEQCPPLRLELFGDGDLMPAARDYVRAFRLEDRVQLFGFQPNHVVLEHIRRAGIFLQHSWWEGLGVAILEAMAHALPVVATRTGGILETVVEGETGFLVEPGDSAAMADRIVTLARHPGLRNRMGAAGWARVREHYTWDQERSQLLRILGLAA